MNTSVKRDNYFYSLMLLLIKKYNCEAKGWWSHVDNDVDVDGFTCHIHVLFLSCLFHWLVGLLYMDRSEWRCRRRDVYLDVRQKYSWICKLENQIMTLIMRIVWQFVATDIGTTINVIWISHTSVKPLHCKQYCCHKLSKIQDVIMKRTLFNC